MVREVRGSYLVASADSFRLVFSSEVRWGAGSSTSSIIMCYYVN